MDADDSTVRISHMIDDHEKLRTHALRTLLRQSELLADALHAIRHNRTAVADEFVDRALAAIDAEIVALRNGATPCACSACTVPAHG